SDPAHPFATGSWQPPSLVNADKLKEAIKRLPRSIIRMKGLVKTDRHGAVIVHYAGRRVRFEALDSQEIDLPLQLVYIGLNNQPLKEQVQACLGYSDSAA